MSAIVQQMMNEEPNINLTPLLDVAFLLLIFLMLQRFRIHFKSSPINLPLESYIYADNLENSRILQIKLHFEKDSKKKVQISLKMGKNFLFNISYKPGKYGKKRMFAQLEEHLYKFWKKYDIDVIEIDSEPKIQFDYIALLVNAINKVKRDLESDLFYQLYTAKKTGNIEYYEAINREIVKITFKSLRYKMEKKQQTSK